MTASQHELSRLRHDLRSPLGQIIGFAEMLAEEAELNRLKVCLEALQDIQERAAAALRSVNESLSSRPGGVRHEDAQQLASRLELGALRMQALAQRLIELPEARPFEDDLHRISGATVVLRELARNDLRRFQSCHESCGAGVESAAEKGTRQEAPNHIAPAAAVEHGRILVVDDSAENREILRRRLGPLGYEIDLAPDGESALARVAEHPADLLLLDIVMPRLDGFEVLKRLKENAATQNIPVLMLSAIDDLDAVVKCIELGADDYLPKPFPAPLLKARVKACLANKRLSDQLRRYTEWHFGRTLFMQAVASPDSLALSQQERTVLFADIRGFTSWTEQHKPEEVVALLNSYFEAAQRILARSSVIKTEYTGDEIMAVFPAPSAAVEIARALQGELGRQLKSLGLGIGIGVHSGPVIEGLMGSADVKAYCFVGDTINTARRICDHARAGEILVSRASCTGAVGAVPAAKRHVFRAKGKKELVEVFELHAPE